MNSTDINNKFRYKNKFQILKLQLNLTLSSTTDENDSLEI